VSPRITAVTCAAGAETCAARRPPRVLDVASVNPRKDFFMKQVVVMTALAVLAGCAEIPDSVKHPFAARGATAQTDTPDVGSATQEASPYPYNPPYGD